VAIPTAADNARTARQLAFIHSFSKAGSSVVLCAALQRVRVSLSPVIKSPPIQTPQRRKTIPTSRNFFLHSSQFRGPILKKY
jgi:hypothetical protein